MLTPKIISEILTAIVDIKKVRLNSARFSRKVFMDKKWVRNFSFFVPFELAMGLELATCRLQIT